MNRLALDADLKKKVRGLQRKYREIENYVIEETEFVLNPFSPSLNYWHLHLPWGKEYIYSYKTPNRFRRKVMQLLIDRVHYLIQEKAKSEKSYQVYAIVYLPYLFHSQLVVVPDKSWFDNYFERQSPDQTWVSLSDERDLAKEWQLHIPDTLSVLGMKERTIEDGESFVSDIWFIGELGDET